MSIECISHVFSGLESPNYGELKEAIQSLQLTPDQLEPYLVEPASLGYGRNVLYLNEDVEVVLIHMPGKRQTQLHDHGGSIGCIYVVEGELVNIAFFNIMRIIKRPLFLKMYQEKGIFLR